MTPEQKQKIIDEFNAWLIAECSKMHTVEYSNPNPIDWWISKIDEAVKEERERQQKNIGLLRQYLNERTSKELITNEEIETFLK